MPIKSSLDLPQSSCCAMQDYLKISEVIDWLHPDILQLAQKLGSGLSSIEAIAKACFEWVSNGILFN